MHIQDDHSRIRKEAIILAGKPSDLVQRSSVYHHLYSHSDRNHVFPLLAAHGALWGSGHFARGMLVGKIFSYCFIGNSDLREYKMKSLAGFAEAFREINRQVCVETYYAYHMTDLHGESSGIEDYVSLDFLENLNCCHHARKTGVNLSVEQKRSLFKSFFYWEQNNVVGKGVERAVAAMDWPVIMWLAMKPLIQFKYFDFSQQLLFKDFGNKNERIEKGLVAFESAISNGLPEVEKSLKDYKIMPKQFFDNSLKFFDDLKQQLLEI